MKRILFIGRFQPFHLGHLSVVKEIIGKCDELILAIGSAEKSHKDINPFTSKERTEMILEAIKAENIPLSKIRIIPISDINNDAKWVNHVQLLTPEFNVVYTGAELTKELFEKAGIEVKPVKFVYGIDATTIRNAVIKGQNWKGLVHPKVAEYLEKIDGIERIKKSNK